jgi:hypothetical protein
MGGAGVCPSLGIRPCIGLGHTQGGIGLRDPLIGKWFLATGQHDDGCRTCCWQGQIIGKPGGGVFLCSLESGSETLVSLGDMRGWKFYDSKDLRDTAYAGTWLARNEAHGQHEGVGARS